MGTTSGQMRKKIVTVARGVPAECIRAAQVIIVTEDTWHLIAPGSLRVHGLSGDIPMPAVTCPVVDVRGVEDFARMRGIMDVCVDVNAGVINMDGLLTGLEALGGKRVSGARGQVSGVGRYQGGHTRPVRKVSGVRGQVSGRKKRKLQ